MNAAYVLLLVNLAADAGASRDGGLPPWLPRYVPAEVAEFGSYVLRRRGDGYVWANDRFEAQVARDGLVTFKNKRGSVIASIFPFNLFSPSKKRESGASVGAAPYPPTPLQNNGSWAPSVPPPAPDSNDRAIPPTERCPEFSGCYTPPHDRMIPLVSVRGKFDLTDEIMRSLGQDPYRLEKAQFLSATFEFRITMAIEARKRDLKRALEQLPSNLDELWGDGRYIARERRRILYELWIEMDHTPEGDRAARTIEDFIHRQLPCGNPEGYSPGEWEALGKTRAGKKFLDGESCGK